MPRLRMFAGPNGSGKSTMKEVIPNIELNELAQAMGVHRNTISRIVHDKGGLTAPMAIKLAAALGNTPEFWLNLQHAVELWDVRHQAYAQEARNVRCILPVRDNNTSSLEA